MDVAVDLAAAHGGRQQTARRKGRDAHAALEVGELAAAKRRVVAAVAQVPAVVLVAQSHQRCQPGRGDRPCASLKQRHVVDSSSRMS